MNKMHSIIIQHIQSIFNKILFLEKKRTLNLDDIKLFPKEIHLILMIKSGESTNATRIAEQLGVTKGAVSQTVSRLEKKGVIFKTKDSSNKNEMTVIFTDFGDQISNKLIKLKDKVEKSYKKILMNFNEQECAIINNFLIGLGETINKI